MEENENKPEPKSAGGLKGFLRTHTAVRYVLSSVSSWVVDNGLYYLFFLLLSMSALEAAVISVISQVSARVLSSFYNYNANYFFVFRKEEAYLPALKKYYLLCIPQTFISTVLVTALIEKLSIASPGLATAAKVAVDTVLFCISYIIQNKWVFRKKK